jgi:hypothetical protein
MPHAYTAVMNGRDICRFLDIPKELIDRQILITIDPVAKTTTPAVGTLQKLFADAKKIKIPKQVRIDSLMEEMNNALP